MPDTPLALIRARSLDALLMRRVAIIARRRERPSWGLRRRRRSGGGACHGASTCRRGEALVEIEIERVFSLARFVLCCGRQINKKSSGGFKVISG